MDKIKNSLLRVGNFTSSEIYKLTCEPTAAKKKEGAIFGAPALEYISECNMERRLQRSLSDESNARPLTWGKLAEKRVFKILDIEYIDGFENTIMHPLIDYWSGSPDATKLDEGKTVAEIKCPLTLKSYCQLADCKTIDEIRENHKDGEKFFWQIVSNAILTDSKFAELIAYVPYIYELEEIREMSADVDGFTQNKFAWINFASDDELPYLLPNYHYKNIHVIRFEVSQADKDALTQKVLKAGQMLVPFFETQTVAA